MVLNILMLSFKPIVLLMVFSINLPVHIPLSKMEYQKGSIDMLLKQVLLSFINPIFPSISGHMLSLLPLI